MDCSGKTKTTGISAIRLAGKSIGIISSMCRLDRMKIGSSRLAVKYGSGTKASAMRVGVSDLKMTTAIFYSAFQRTSIFIRRLEFVFSFTSRAPSKQAGSLVEGRGQMTRSHFL